jgi:hypothetical protein
LLAVRDWQGRVAIWTCVNEPAFWFVERDDLGRFLSRVLCPSGVLGRTERGEITVELMA